MQKICEMCIHTRIDVLESFSVSHDCDLARAVSGERVVRRSFRMTRVRRRSSIATNCESDQPETRQPRIRTRESVLMNVNAYDTIHTTDAFL